MKYKNLLKYNNFLNFHENLIRKKTNPNLQNWISAGANLE